MLIAHISDSHIAVPATSGHDRMADLAAGVDYINRCDPLPDVVVHTGDIAHNGEPAEYAEALRILTDLEPRLYAMAGNRDERGALRVAFSQTVPADCHGDFIQYCVAVPNAYLIMLDTVSTHSNKGQLCEKRLAHLTGMLDAADDRPVTIFMHHAPFNVIDASDPIQFEDLDAVAAFAGIISKHSNVQRICGGHSHRAARGKVVGITASTIPSLAEDLRQGKPASREQICPIYSLD